MQITKIIVSGLFLLFSVTTVIFVAKAIWTYFWLARSVKPSKNTITNLVPMSMLLPGTYDKDGKKEYQAFIVSLGIALFSFLGAFLIKVFYF